MANNEYRPVTAQDAIAPLGELSVDVEARKRAEEAGVVDAGHVDYEKALENYQGRSDIETLAQRRARENGVSFKEGAEVREVQDSAYVEGDALVAARKGAKESRDFKAAQAKETAKVSEGKEVASAKDVAKEQAAAKKSDK